MHSCTAATSHNAVFPSFMLQQRLKRLTGQWGGAQERAYVTGLRAATLVTEHLQTGRPAVILDTDADEPHLAVGKAVARTFRQTLERTGLPSLFL